MPEESKQPAGHAQAARLFEQPADAPSFYAENAQILSTGNEVIIQFYELVPGPPTPPEGQIKQVRSRLRATVTVSVKHAANIGELLLKQVGAPVELGRSDEEG
jgi:hypothetical protein